MNVRNGTCSECQCPTELIYFKKKSFSPDEGNYEHTLPQWIFDVEDEDEYEGNSSLLQELEIDFVHIYK